MYISGTQCDIYTYMQFTLIKSILLSLPSHTLLNIVQKIDRYPNIKFGAMKLLKETLGNSLRHWYFQLLSRYILKCA